MRGDSFEAIAREVELNQVDERSESVLADDAQVTAGDVEALEVEQACVGEDVVLERGQAVLGEVEQLRGGVEARRHGGERGACAQRRLLAAAPLALAVARAIGGGGRRQCEHHPHPHRASAGRHLTLRHTFRLRPQATSPKLRPTCKQNHLSL